MDQAFNHLHQAFNGVLEKSMIQDLLADSFFKKPVYHGGSTVITEFNRPSHGICFTPHLHWAESHYGIVITKVWLISKKVYIVQNKGTDALLIDALLDMNYPLLIKFIRILERQGYDALQTKTDSEMICAFDSTNIIIQGD